MSRKEELLLLFKDADEGKKLIVEQLIDEAVFLEAQMQALKKYPLIRFHPTNPNLQKITAAGKQYREFLQTYVNCIDKLAKYYMNTETIEESPLRDFLEAAGGLLKGAKE